MVCAVPGARRGEAAGYSLARSEDQRALDQRLRRRMRLVIALRNPVPVTTACRWPTSSRKGMFEAARSRRGSIPTGKCAFSTYATWWIRASIQVTSCATGRSCVGGTSSTQKALFFNLRRLRAQLSRTGRKTRPTVRSHRQGAVGASPADVEMMNARFSGPGHLAERPGSRRRYVRFGGAVIFLVDRAPCPTKR